MSWMETYRSRVTTAANAVAAVRSGQRVCIGSGCAQPQLLVRSLLARAAELQDVELVHILTLGGADYAREEYRGHFRHNALFVGGNVREAVNRGLADFVPIFLSEIPAAMRSDLLRPDVALIQVAPPDEHGFCSFGVSVDVVKPAAQAARTVIAEVNDQMPRTLGDSFIHVSKLAAVVEVSTPVLTLPREEFSDVHRAIGRHVGELVEDGATLQMGIGAIPDAVLSFLHGKRHLGIHTEMFSDGLMELVEEGVVTNEKKTLHPGKVVSSFLMGSRKLYDFVDNNPLIELHPSDYTNDPFNIARNYKMTAINSAVAVDITGQVCADSIGTSQYSGIGGQVDFVRGAARSDGGKPIIALPSTAKGGAVSRIVPVLESGSGVVTSRGDVHWVATEHGAVDLHGLNMRQRARALIALAHPDFREGLERAARERHLA
jgi:4-hydroxybutyrate CoA-transferase